MRGRLGFAISIMRMAKTPKKSARSDVPFAAGHTKKSNSSGSKQLDANGAMTPMMAQYTEIKTANPDSLLFYRMGDFYELFFEDAVAASQALGIALTKRGKHLGQEIPMCGVPVHTADDYLQKLIARGFRVAVCEQTEDPAEAKKRGAKAVVRRDVVRLVTPGTITESNLLEAGRHNFLSALFPYPQSAVETERWAVASFDISTGDFVIGSVSGSDLAGELTRIGPSEILVPDVMMVEEQITRVVELCAAAATPLPKSSFDSSSGVRNMKAGLGVNELEGFGTFSRPELAAAGAVLRYVELTQIGRRPLLKAPTRFGSENALVIDAATRRNLEIARTTSGERAGSLLNAVDRTVTPAGARLLSSLIASPLREPSAIAARLDAVGFFLERTDLRERLRESLRQAPDLARALSRLTFSRGGPRDLGAIRDAVASANSCAHLLAEAGAPTGLPIKVTAISKDLGGMSTGLLHEFNSALSDELPLQRRDGGFVRQGYRDDLDENRTLRDESRQVMASLQTRYQDETKVKSLKVRHNNVLGFFVEVTAVNSERLMQPPLNETFRHRQTLANVVRFTTDELSGIEGRITAAGERANAIEQEIFADLSSKVTKDEARLAATGDALAWLDHFTALATVAEEQALVRPKMDNSLAFEIAGGRHPVVEQALARAKEGPFIENNCVLGLVRDYAARDTCLEPDRFYGDGFELAEAARLLILTGPNMAGKSTYLRQNALIAILAQAGSYVPARAAHIGVVDRLFSRVGASDDLARGRSTFMVEMVETAGILNQATERSLVILDEIGRGTATFDGLSIAWATIEHLHEVNRCRTLFATHYHELTALAGTLGEVANATIEVKEWRDDIVFLHKVVPGAADRSYGIQVARLAGLPRAVIERAGEVLRLLEQGEDQRPTEVLIEELPLFAAARTKDDIATHEGLSALEETLLSINPDELTPREALETIYRLKDAAGDNA